MRCQSLRLALLLALVLPSSACDRAPEVTATGALASTLKSPEVEARELFAERCLPCHGAQGKGDGPAAGECNPKPTDLSDGARLARLSDAELRRLILLGGKATARSNQMPPNSDLAGRAAALEGLVSIVRGFAPK